MNALPSSVSALVEASWDKLRAKHLAKMGWVGDRTLLQRYSLVNHCPDKQGQNS